MTLYRLNQRIEIMKQFSLDEYFKNPTRPIVTRDGRSVRIVCTDGRYENYPIIALVEDEDGKKDVETYTIEGSSIDGYEHPCDLFFASEKKEGWIKVYHGKGRYNTFVCNRIFATKEEAEKQKNDNVLAIMKIEWEE